MHLDIDSTWQPCHEFPSLGSREAHVWSVDLTATPEQLERFRSLLIREELDRAARFRFERDRDAYIIGRGSLRHLLGRYLSVNPSSIELSYQSHGKPELHPDFLEKLSLKIRFNVSHSGGKALVAVTLEGDLGVDIERFKTSVLKEGLAERFFAAEEALALSRLPESEQLAAFFACWTRKEAFLKAHGGGLSVGLETFAVTLDPRQEPAILWSDSVPDAVERLRLVQLPVGEGFAASLVIPSSVHRIQLLQFQPT